MFVGVGYNTEEEVMVRTKQRMTPREIHVSRGFGDAQLEGQLLERRFDFVIRC